MQLFDGHAVVQVLDGFSEDGVGIDVLFQAHAGGADQVAHFLHVEGTALAVFRHVDLGRGQVGLAAGGFLGQAALFHVLGAVQHVAAGDVVFARAHQGQFDLVLHVFDVDGAAARMAAHQGGHHAGGQLFDLFADAGRHGALAAMHGKEGLGDGDGDLGRFESDHGAVAADDAVVAAGGEFGGAGGRRGAGRTWGHLHGIGGNVL